MTTITHASASELALRNTILGKTEEASEAYERIPESKYGQTITTSLRGKSYTGSIGPGGQITYREVVEQPPKAVEQLPVPVGFRSREIYDAYMEGYVSESERLKGVPTASEEIAARGYSFQEVKLPPQQIPTQDVSVPSVQPQKDKYYSLGEKIGQDIRVSYEAAESKAASFVKSVTPSSEQLFGKPGRLDKDIVEKKVLTPVQTFLASGYEAVREKPVKTVATAATFVVAAPVIEAIAAEPIGAAAVTYATVRYGAETAERISTGGPAEAGKIAATEILPSMLGLKVGGAKAQQPQKTVIEKPALKAPIDQFTVKPEKIQIQKVLEVNLARNEARGFVEVSPVPPGQTTLTGTKATPVQESLFTQKLTFRAIPTSETIAKTNDLIAIVPKVGIEAKGVMTLGGERTIVASKPLPGGEFSPRIVESGFNYEGVVFDIGKNKWVDTEIFVTGEKQQPLSAFQKVLEPTITGIRKDTFTPVKMSLPQAEAATKANFFKTLESGKSESPLFNLRQISYNRATLRPEPLPRIPEIQLTLQEAKSPDMISYAKDLRKEDVLVRRVREQRNILADLTRQPTVTQSNGNRQVSMLQLAKPKSDFVPVSEILKGVTKVTPQIKLIDVLSKESLQRVEKGVVLKQVRAEPVRQPTMLPSFEEPRLASNRFVGLSSVISGKKAKKQYPIETTEYAGQTVSEPILMKPISQTVLLSGTLGNNKVSDILRVEPITKQEVRSVLEIKPKEDQKQISIQAQTQEQKQIQEPITIQQQDQIQLARVSTKTKQVTDVTSRSRERPSRFRPFSLVEPEAKRKRILLEKIKKKRGFLAFIKRKGKFVQVGPVTTKESALDIGTRAAKETLAATFKVREVSATPQEVRTGGEFARFKQQFRPYELKKGKIVLLADTYIQKRGTRLGTRSEVKEIKVAKAKSSFIKGKSGGKKWI